MRPDRLCIMKMSPDTLPDVCVWWTEHLVSEWVSEWGVSEQTLPWRPGRAAKWRLTGLVAQRRWISSGGVLGRKISRAIQFPPLRIHGGIVDHRRRSICQSIPSVYSVHFSSASGCSGLFFSYVCQGSGPKWFLDVAASFVDRMSCLRVSSFQIFRYTAFSSLAVRRLSILPLDGLCLPSVASLSFFFCFFSLPWIPAWLGIQ